MVVGGGGRGSELHAFCILYSRFLPQCAFPTAKYFAMLQIFSLFSRFLPLGILPPTDFPPLLLPDSRPPVSPNIKVNSISRPKGTMVTYGGMSKQPVTVPTVCGQFCLISSIQLIKYDIRTKS